MATAKKASTKKSTTQSTKQAAASKTAAGNKTEKAAPKTTEARLNDIEKRLAALEGSKCEMTEKMKKCWSECKVPSQDEARKWVKANPFLALAIAVLGTALIVSIIS